MPANIRVFCETTKFLEEFLILALISHRFGFTSHWSVGPVDKSPFGRRFSIHGFAQILSLQQRFSLSFAAIDISLHANYALILLNTNCTNYTNKVYHQYSVPTIFQVVTPICFLKNVIFVPHAVSLCTCRRSNEEYCFYTTFERITSGEVPIRGSMFQNGTNFFK